MTTTDSAITVEVRRTASWFGTQLGALLDLVPQLYRLLAVGEPVTVRRLAAAGGVAATVVAAQLAKHPGVDWDEDGRIVGFGLTLQATPHAFTFDGRTVFAFCASDALQFPIVLGRLGVLESACPVTGQRIRVELTPGHVVRVEPPQAVVSKLRPDPDHVVADVRAEICSLGQIFRSPETATDWLTHYPQGRVVPVAEDFEVTRRLMTELGWAAPISPGG